MRTSVFRQGKWLDVFVPRKSEGPLVPVRLRGGDEEVFLCQLCNMGRFGWTVVVSGDVRGIRLVEGFKQQWQAIRYAINIRTDLGHDGPEL